MPAYSASKAALNAFILCLREQLRDCSVKIIELSPPAVQSKPPSPALESSPQLQCKVLTIRSEAELHDYMGEEKGRAVGMPLDEFTDQAYKGLAAGKDQVFIGSIGPPEPFYDIVNKRRTAAENLAKVMRGH